MPRFDFACTADHVFEVFLAPQRQVNLDDFALPCAECGEPAMWKPTAQFQPEFKPLDHEHLGPESVHVESREQYRRMLVERDCYGPGVEPGSATARSMISMHEERRAKARAEEAKRA
ncbi:MAG: hypothetical protein ACRD2A_19205 [Vicinamibacterales bacterium]